MDETSAQVYEISMDSHVSESSKSSYVLKDDSGRQYVVSDNKPEVQTGDKPYPEMTKEHLLRHSSKPFWNNLRRVSIAIIALSWIALIAATIAIIVVHPRCKEAPSVSWWQKSVVYRVYVRSFRDSDGDGVGDLKGVTSRLDYLQSLGVGTVSLSAFYEHAAENEFSVLNHTEVNGRYGNLEDFQELATALHDKNMRLILDFIPGTTSDQHDFFRESASSSDRDNSYRGYYVWDSSPYPPNNWLSVYSSGDSGPERAWTYSDTRNQSYLHQFLTSQPSLNLRNRAVQEHLEDVLRFWLDRGADGFYVRNSAYLFVDSDFRDEMVNPANISNNPDDYDYYKHDFTFGQPEISDMFARWRYLAETYANANNEDRLLIADIHGDAEQTMAYYQRFGRDGVNFPLNFNLLPVSEGCNGACVKRHMDVWLGNIPSDKWGTWMVGTEDAPRLATRAGNSSLSRPLTLLSMLLPGTPISYYGDEIGMGDVTLTNTNQWSMAQSMRGLMQWSNETDGGFSNCTTSCSPWIPSNDDFHEKNVKIQQLDPSSELNFYKKLVALRQKLAVEYGNFRYLTTNENILSFLREFDGQSTILVAVNFGRETVKADFPADGDVTEGAVELATHPRDESEETVSLTGLELRPGEGIVLSWDFQIKQYT